MSAPMTPAQINAAHDALQKHGNQVAAAKALGLSRQALQARLARPPSPGAGLSEKDEIRTLKKENADLVALSTKTQRDLDAVTGLVDACKEVKTPDWTLKVDRNARSSPGVPVAFLSDLHWGEVVDPTQVNGVNQYNLKIAQSRLRRFTETTIDLLTNHLSHPSYPGLILPLGGDMISGDIHEELKETNEVPTLAVVVDIVSCLTWAVTKFAETFGHVHIPVVVGNHGRMTHKPRHKHSVQTNMDWLIAKMLQLAFAKDKRISFQISDSSDTLFRAYNTSILLTHGNQFFGGSGIAGMLSPLMLGNARKQQRQAAIKQSYDIMMLGHWHQLFQGKGLIVNGSLKGYDEYAFNNNFGYEVARQALFLVHPSHGLNWWMPVNVQDPLDSDKNATWCSVKIAG